jgi:hypothetical protein
MAKKIEKKTKLSPAAKKVASASADTKLGITKTLTKKEKQKQKREKLLQSKKRITLMEHHI